LRKLEDRSSIVERGPLKPMLLHLRPQVHNRGRRWGPGVIAQTTGK